MIGVAGMLDLAAGEYSHGVCTLEVRYLGLFIKTIHYVAGKAIDEEQQLAGQHVHIYTRAEKRAVSLGLTDLGRVSHVAVGRSFLG